MLVFRNSVGVNFSLILVCGLHAAQCLAQHDYAENGVVKHVSGVAQVTTTMDGRVYAVPDPSSLWEAFSVLEQSQVQELVGLDDLQSELVANIFARFRQRWMELNRKARLDGFRGITRELYAKYRELAEEDIAELLTPPQADRLRQVVYRIEIQRAGWADAVALGRLSETIGVHDSQRETLHRRVQQISSELRATIENASLEAEREILKELTPEQREAARQALGEPVFFNETTRFQRQYNEAKLRIEVMED